MNIRPATQIDQKTIERIIRDANINPMSLDWHRFIVAEDERQGIASEIIRALLANEQGDLYLICRDELESFYARFGFYRIDPKEMTPYFRTIIRVVNIFARVAGRRGSVMKREKQ